MKEAKDHNGQQMAIFEVANETYGIQISTIKEIVRMPALTNVPNAPDFLAGLTNLRNRVLPVIDTRRRLRLEPCEPTDSTRVLVLEGAGSTTGIIVDRVRG